MHFPEVSALIDELLDQHLERTLRRAYRSLPGDASLVDALVHVGDALFAGYTKEADLARAFLSATMFRAEPDGPSSARLAGFRSWVMERMISARTQGELSPEIDLDVVFESFFCLYYGLVIGGLRGDIGRRRQTWLLRSALTAFLGGEA